ncbi:MAG: (Fe-S)-binding protein, partial [Acidimicrobiia bacterium]
MTAAEGRLGSPSVAELAAPCIHCGLCLPTCPTYALWGNEADSPRGRVLLARAAAEENVSLATVAVHFDRCLGCMACLTSCPAGVPYDRLLGRARSDIETSGARSCGERAWRRLLLALLTHPARLQAAAPGTIAAARLRLAEVASPLLRRTPRLAALTALATVAGARARTPRSGRSPGSADASVGVAVAPGVPARRERVALLAGCAQRVLFSEINQAADRVLQAEGFEVAAPAAPRCCGALAHH